MFKADTMRSNLYLRLLDRVRYFLACLATANPVTYLKMLRNEEGYTITKN